jgi:hypothetical protein
MIDESLSEALKEAYASASANTPIIPTLSVYYDGLLNDDNDPDELYLFNGFNYDTLDANGVPKLTAMIESLNAINGGRLVEFTGIPFQIGNPNVTEEAQVSASVTIDNVQQEMIDLLIRAASLGKSIQVTYREYLPDGKLVGPENDPPLRLKLFNVKANSVNVTGSLTTLSIGNRRFPYELYDAARFKTLQFA